MRILTILLIIILSSHSATFADKATIKKSYQNDLSSLLRSLTLANPFRPNIKSKFKTLDDKTNALEAFVKKHGLKPTQLVHKQCLQFYSSPGRISFFDDGLLDTCREWGWLPNKDPSFINDIKPLDDALGLAEKFHPIRGQNFNNLSDEFNAWIQFEKIWGLLPKQLIYKYCSKYNKSPLRDEVAFAHLHGECLAWGWLPDSKIFP